MPTQAATPKTRFELRAYDARGAFERQVWTVDVTGANRAPIIAPVEDVLATEGDLIEIPISAFDPDGDRLFYFADNLPPGAVFDSFGQTLRWRPGGNDAGVYENVKLIASDGFVETSVTFEIVIANNNVAPILAPVADRTLNEGDAISFRLFADRRRRRSIALPFTELAARSLLGSQHRAVRVDAWVRPAWRLRH